MKATRAAFEKAIAPVLADLHREHPALLRLAMEPEDAELQGWLWERDGSGTGVYLGDGWESEADAVLEVTDKVQEAAIEAVWAHTGNSTWPVCPDHPDGAPLDPGLHAGAAFWFCPYDNRAIAEVGSLGRGESEAVRG